MIVDLITVSNKKVMDMETGRIMNIQEARNRYSNIRMVDQEVVELARRLQKLRRDPQMKLKDYLG